MSGEKGAGSRTAVFAYGSLVSAESAACTLSGRRVEPRPAALRGWRRAFSLRRDNHRSEKTFARVADGSIPDWVLGLNLEPAGDVDRVNGALIEVGEDELARLDLREIRYARREVTTAVEGPVQYERVVAYVARAENHAVDPPSGAVILKSYAEAVERAFAELGPAELGEYRRTTEIPAVEVVEASLVRDRIPEGNPRAW